MTAEQRPDPEKASDCRRRSTASTRPFGATRGAIFSAK